MNTAKIALAATASAALILLAACGGGGKKTLKAGIPESGADSVDFTDARELRAAPIAPDTGWYAADSGAAVFTISTAEELAGLAELVNLGKKFRHKTIKLERDIVINDTANWQDWANNPPARQWTAIGTDKGVRDEKRFHGTFDGGGHTISGVYIKNEKYDQGLFGVTHGKVKRLNVTASYVEGAGSVGILAGGNAGAVTECYASGIAVGKKHVGGFAGVNDGMISGSGAAGSVKGKINAGGFIGVNRTGAASGNFSSAAVSGDSIVGGFVGANLGVLIYGNLSTGKVTGNADAGGFAGRSYGGLMQNNYYDRETSGQSDSGKGEGKTTVQIQSAELVDSLNAYAAISSANTWVHSGGKYPALSDKPAESANIDSYFASGEGTEANPYIINTKEHLENFSLLVNTGTRFVGKHLKLGQDIVLNDTTNWQQWATEPPVYIWVPAGILINPFDGTFDGGGHAISGVYVNSPESHLIGLFGYISNAATIKNVGVTASYIRGGYTVGGLVGENYGGTITGCHTTGAVSGVRITGGLAGANSKNGIIINSYATGAVEGGDFTGGLVGSNARFEDHSSTVSKCYATGAVSGKDYVGGLAGLNNSNSKIRDSYATGAAEGNDKVGGLVGGNGGRINNCYSIGKVKGNNCVKKVNGICCGSGNTGGLAGSGEYSASNSYFDSLTSGQKRSDDGAGKSTEQMKQRETFYGWNFSKTWGIDSKVNNGYPYLLDEAAISASKTVWENAEWYTANPEAKTFTISTAGELAVFAEIVNGAAEDIARDGFHGKTVRLVKNIDLSRCHDWVPVGNRWSDKEFRGTFDGSGHVISNLTINSKEGGLFGCIKGGTVKNLGLENVNIRAGGDAGGIVGYISDTGSIFNCYTTGKVAGAGHKAAGGIAGMVWSGSSITNCYSTAAIRVSDYGNGGGLAGWVSASFISNSYSTGDVSGRQRIGGLAGVVVNSVITGCYSTGTINGDYEQIGGLIGEAGGKGRVTGCAALNTEVKGKLYIGRVAGRFRDDGDDHEFNLSNNAAWAQMKNTDAVWAQINNNDDDTNWPDRDAAKENGADISLSDIMADPTIGGRFTTANGWTVKKGKLPGLRGKTVEMPEHLRKTP